MIEGPSGCGKTHLAVAVMNASIEKGLPAKYVSALNIPDIVSISIYNQRDDETVDGFAPLMTAPLLVIDDLGAQQSASWVDSRIDQLLTHRFNRGLPTVIVLAVARDQLPERIAMKLLALDFSVSIVISALDQLGRESGSRIPKTMLERMTFEAFNHEGGAAANTTERESLNIALATAKEFAENPNKWLYLHGHTGVGKTHLAIAIANVRIARNQPVTFWTTPDLLDRLRHTQSRDGNPSFYELFEEVRNSEMLILDDFGAQSMTNWALEKMYQLMAYRHDRLMPTVVTSQYIIWDGAENKNIEHMHGKQQWESLRSRIRDSSVVTERLMVAPDYRNRLA